MSKPSENLSIGVEMSLALTVDREAFESASPQGKRELLAEEALHFLEIIFEEGGVKEVAESVLDEYEVLADSD